MRHVILSFTLIATAAAASASEQPIVASIPAPQQNEASDALGDYGAVLSDASMASDETTRPAAVGTPRGDGLPIVASPVGTPGNAPFFPGLTGASPSSIAGNSESLGDAYSTPTPSDPAIPNVQINAPSNGEPQAPSITSDQARGLALLPSRPESAEIKFVGVPAGQVALMFAREYRTAIVLSGDGSTPITGWTPRTDSVAEMLKAFFPLPEWTISSLGNSYVVTQKTGITFRRITLAALNPNLEGK